MRILLINPNTSATVTDLVAGHVRAQLGERAELRAVTGRFGARYIVSRSAAAIAGHAALEALAEHEAGCDAVFLACFGDPGLFALRDLSRVPVIGMAEAACLEASARGPFGIVTGGAAWEPMLREFVSMLGLADQLAAIRTVAPSGGEIARDPDAALDALAEACRACAAVGADSVILGGAGLAGLASRLAPRVPRPLICSVEAGTRAVLTALRGGSSRRAAPPPVETIGLAPVLATRLAAPE
ncbi:MULTISPECIES: aspartate/glutamate racemase family protein [unclassified Methylobacterium]|jgi:Asp/Glu/hydantoin racemase|uniref:aspartate/glutamate racemase family protein n=1 Tax=unclassified Methylobacterium TaxID=2615210 RepID=UPI001353C91E|nr:aspartate/glutamate racemase family protein [Methylobacterium sp. 2A]MWV22165.1 Asp/Glu racemase [Methylobacterium sp. 2A]